MTETVTQTGPVTFPRHGNDYVPLPRGKENGRVQAHAVQTIAASPEQVYHVYSRAELLPAWQEGVVSVTPTGANQLHWVMQDPASGKQIEFNAEVLEAVPGVRHVSRILDGPFESTTDTVTFEQAPASRGTQVTWVADYMVPGGVVANAIAAVASRSPEQMTIENLRHLKQLIESKEIPSVEGQSAGPRGVIGTWKRFLMGENMPPPPGSSERARPSDMPDEQSNVLNGAVLGGLALVLGLATWYGLRKAR